MTRTSEGAWQNRAKPQGTVPLRTGDQRLEAQAELSLCCLSYHLLRVVIPMKAPFLAALLFEWFYAKLFIRGLGAQDYADRGPQRCDGRAEMWAMMPQARAISILCLILLRALLAPYPKGTTRYTRARTHCTLGSIRGKFALQETAQVPEVLPSLEQ